MAHSTKTLYSMTALTSRVHMHLEGDQTLDAGMETLPQGEDVDAFEVRHGPTEWLDGSA
jgi:hypothetical protein